MKKNFANSIKVSLFAGSVAVGGVFVSQGSHVGSFFGMRHLFFYFCEFFKYFFCDRENCESFWVYIYKYKCYEFLDKLKYVFGKKNEKKKSGKEGFCGWFAYDEEASYKTKVVLHPDYGPKGYSCSVAFCGKTYFLEDKEEDIKRVKSEFCKASGIYDKFLKKFYDFGKYMDYVNLYGKESMSITFEISDFKVNIQEKEVLLKKIVYNPFLQTVNFLAEDEDGFLFFLGKDEEEEKAFKLLEKIHSLLCEKEKKENEEIQRKNFERNQLHFVEIKKSLEKIMCSNGFKVEVDDDKNLKYVISSSVYGFNVKIECLFPTESSSLHCYFFVNGQKVGDCLVESGLPEVDSMLSRLKNSLYSCSKHLEIFKNFETSGLFTVSENEGAFEFIITPSKNFNIINRDNDESFSLSRIVYRGKDSTALLYSKDYYDGKINFDFYDLRDEKEKKKFFKLFVRDNSVEKFIEQRKSSENF